MNLTERAVLMLDIAKRIHAEKMAGRSVDPSRLDWADAIVKGNTPPVEIGSEYRLEEVRA